MKDKWIIELEDNGQDFLRFILDIDGVVLRSEPFQTEIWRGAIIPFAAPIFQIGEECPIHNPPHIIYGFLRHKVKSIKNQ